LASRQQVPTFRTMSLSLVSRRLHAGRHSASRQAPSELYPRPTPGFGDIPTLSTRHQRFTRVRLTSAHLTGYPRLFRNAHYPGHCAGAACGGLNPDPAIRVRGADPHLLCSKAASIWLRYISGQRPLGVPTLEDKIVQGAVAEMLSAIYEVDFLGFSYGFRPRRSPHQALSSLHTAIMSRNVNWVLDADIRSFFDSVDHEWLLRMLAHRVADPRIIRLVELLDRDHGTRLSRTGLSVTTLIGVQLRVAPVQRRGLRSWTR